MVCKSGKRRVGLESLGPLLIFGISGFVSMALDIDHFVALVWFPEGNIGRIFHPTVGVAAGIVFILIGTYCGGLYIKHLLRRWYGT